MPAPRAKPFRMPRKPRDNPEERIQISIASALDAAGILWCHVHNEGKTSAREGGRRKARGVKAGVPDIMIFDPPLGFRVGGAAIELKSPRGTTSPEQDAWLAALAARGWATAVCRSEAEALARLRAWGYRV